MQELNYGNFRVGAAAAIITGVLLLCFSFLCGNNDSFLLLNGDGGATADFFFRYVTWLGDGIFWVPMLAFFIGYHRRSLVLLVASFAFSEILIDVFKYLVLKDSPRPIKAIPDLRLVHTVPGVEVHQLGSFPSGHTTAACCFFLLLCLLIPRKWIVPVGFIYVLLVGYSRIYLAQHFPRDVGGGLLIATVSTMLGVAVQRVVWRRSPAR